MKGLSARLGISSVLILNAVFGLFQASPAFAETSKVRTFSELRHALDSATAGSVIEILPGPYRRGFLIKDLHGRPEAPIIITGADKANPPIFEGGLGEGLKVSSSSYIKFSNIVFRDFSGNGINIDDSGRVDQPTHHVVLENIRIENIGPKGNIDALKMSGVEHFILRAMNIEGWGGSAVDLVGCRNGVLENSRIMHRKGYRTANGIQIKGGSQKILVQNNHFVNAGARAVQIGGLTGLRYFRPSVQSYEAKDITVAGNTFIGGESQIAWVTTQDSHVHHNLFYLPGKWLGRILQESQDSRFLSCRRGLFEKNLVMLDDKVLRILGIGKGTMPESFLFRANVWNRSAKAVNGALPTAETNGAYDRVLEMRVAPSGRLEPVAPDYRVRGVGPWAYSPPKPAIEFADVLVP
jgi:hypothetical protein